MKLAGRHLTPDEEREVMALILDHPPPPPEPRWRVWRLRMPSGHITTAAMPAPATSVEVLAAFPSCRRCWPADSASSPT